MNQVFEAKRPAKAATKARAKFRQVRKAEQRHSLDSNSAKTLQVKRLRYAYGCSEATALTLAALAFGEARS